MQPAIDDVVRKKIIDLYLAGVHPQSQIALLVDRSDGTVSNVIRDFVRRLGQRDVKAMRTMAVAMQEAAIDAEQCVIGYRMWRQLSALRMSADSHGDIAIASLERFVNNIYQSAKESAMPEDKVIEYAGELFKVSNNEAVQPSEVPKYIEEKIREKAAAEKEVDEIKVRTQALRDEENKALQDAKVTRGDLEQFAFARDELEKHGRQITDIPRLANMLNNAEQLGYNATKIAARLSEEESMDEKVQKEAAIFSRFELDIVAKAKELKQLQNQIASNQGLVNEINELQDLGCGPSELKLLRGTITGIVKVSGKKTTPQKAFKKLIEDISTRYDKVIGFADLEKKFNKLSEQYSKLQIEVPLLEQQKREAENYIKNVLPEFTNRLDSFTKQLGIAEQNINHISEKVNKDAMGYFDDYENLLIIKQAGRFEKVINAHYGRRNVKTEDLLDPLHLALDVMIRRLEKYKPDDVYVIQKDVDQLRKVLHKAVMALEEFERRLGLSVIEPTQHKDSEVA